jgi:ribulose-5-phosphate 4-epimerase/fuculose-1-phosphate aldolase
MLNQDICNFYDSIAVYNSYGGIVFAEEEGRNIARALGEKKKVRLIWFNLDEPVSVFNPSDPCLIQVAILLNHGLLSTGSTVDEAGFLFGLLDRGCAIQLQVEAARAGNPNLVKHVVSDEESAYNFKMAASEPNILYAEAQPDLEYEIEMAGPAVVERGVEDMKIDLGL